jgi:homeobox-leucine zipper protein
MDFGDDQEGGSESQQQQQQRRKRYHRHTPRQIQTLEAYAPTPFLLFFVFLRRACSSS